MQCILFYICDYVSYRIKFWFLNNCIIFQFDLRHYHNQISFKSMSRNHKFMNSKARPNIQLRNPSEWISIATEKSSPNWPRAYVWFHHYHTHTQHTRTHTHTHRHAHTGTHTQNTYFIIQWYTYISLHICQWKESTGQHQHVTLRTLITMTISPFITSPWRMEHNTDIYFEILAVTWPLHIPLKRSFQTSKICVSLNIRWTLVEVLAHWTRIIVS